MGLKDEKLIIENAFKLAWKGRTPIFYEEVPYSQEPSEYVKLWIVSGSAFRLELGRSQKLFRFMGVVSVDIVVPQDTGTARARELADHVIDIFLGKEIDGVKIYNLDISHDKYSGKYVMKLHFSTKWDEHYD